MLTTWYGLLFQDKLVHSYYTKQHHITAAIFFMVTSVAVSTLTQSSVFWNADGKWITSRSSRTAWSTLHVARAALAKFGLPASNTKFNTQNEEWTCIRIITWQFYPWTFLCIMCNKNILSITGKIYNKMRLTAQGRVSLFLAHFYKTN